jgi:subtilisin family serine protease
MDGQTTVVTRAASEAVRRGITVVTAAGNAGAQPWHFIIAPADADTVIAAGAVDSLNVVTAFSSRGPTADGRTKPDVTAMGRSVYVPSFSSSSTYGRVSGTSLATPLTAGLVALLLESHPTWGPFEIREALRETALNHNAPNNDIGWGLVQGLSAVDWVPSTTDVPGGSLVPVALAAAPNPFRRAGGTLIRFSATGPVTLDAHDARGRRVARLFEGVADGSAEVFWRGTNDGGSALAPGVYWLRLSGPQGTGARAEARRVVLLP